MNRFFRILVFGGTLIALIFTYHPSLASNDIEVDGLIIDQTRSKFGHDFYQTFNNLWEDLPGIKDYNIIMVEDQSDPKSGTWISIEINTVVVFRSLLKPNSDSIEDSVKEAIEFSKEFLYTRDEYEKNLQEEKDIKGDGIK